MKIAFLTAGGIAPCLSAAIGGLIEKYNKVAPEADLIGYLNGYQGLLLGESITIPERVKQSYQILYEYGGSPIGNSRVKLTNVQDCVRRGLVPKGADPLAVAARQLAHDGVDVLHTIGGDDTNTAAADLARYLQYHDYQLTVIGLPKTVDNDVYPIHQTLGAWTAAEQGAIFFENVANENTTSRRQLIIHEIMGRNCGWLTAYTAWEYHRRLARRNFLPEILIEQSRWDIDAIFLPELSLDFDREVERLRACMDEKDTVNIFLSEGAGVETIVADMEAAGETVRRDAFGHIRLDEINPGQWFARQLTDRLGAEKTLVQKSGYFARSAAPNAQDLDLIKASAALAAEYALKEKSGVIGLDEDNENTLTLIDFARIKGHKPFNPNQSWFTELLAEIGQPNHNH